MTTVHVSTPSRLHFGLLRLHPSDVLGFGGLGAMIAQPRVVLNVSAAEKWDVSGPAAKRAAIFAERALAAIDSPDKRAALRVQVESIVPQHRGLGGGTQLALAIAAGVRELLEQSSGTATEFAAAVGRGLRSAVGSHGFIHGGLIWEQGRTSNGGLAELSARIALPSSWRFVLAAPPRRRGLSGLSEHAAFDRLPPVPADVTRRLEAFAEEAILPAARAADIDAFGEAVYQYGRLSGECFASVQGGPYASADIAECVAAIRSCGVRGVGQSSWGPTVFAITADDSAANDLARTLRQDLRWRDYEIAITAPDNRGAVITRDASLSKDGRGRSRTA
jgi:beta-ribofuranosylaminobenzene 5'-phosphate synthase